MSASVNQINEFVLDFIANLDVAEEFRDFTTEAWNNSSIQKQLKKLIADSTNTKKTKTKDANKPKRAKSAYNFFCINERENAIKNLGDDYEAKNVMSELGRMWKELKDGNSASVKKKMTKYENMASDDKKRYQEEMDNYTPSDSDSTNTNPNKTKSDSDTDSTKTKSDSDSESDTDSTKTKPDSDSESDTDSTKTKPDSDSKKANKMGFDVYVKESIDDLMEEDEINKTEAMKILRKNWKELSDCERNEWIQYATEEQ